MVNLNKENDAFGKNEKNEKLLILEMLADGKITPEEALKLIEALGTKEDTNKSTDDYNDYDDGLSSSWNVNFGGGSGFMKKVDEFTKKAEQFADQFANKGFAMFDKIFEGIGNIEVFGEFDANDFVKTFEAQVDENYSFDVEIKNAQIIIKRHNLEKIIVNSKFKSSSIDFNIDNDVYLFSEGNKVKFLSEAKDVTRASHEIFIPYKIADRIKIDTKNSKIVVESVVANVLEADCKNTLLDLKNVETGVLHIELSNGRILLDGHKNLVNVSDSLIDMDVKNGLINIVLKDDADRGYKVTASTKNGLIDIKLPNMIYKDVSGSYTSKFVEAESSNIEAFTKNVKITANAKNGNISLVNFR